MSCHGRGRVGALGMLLALLLLVPAAVATAHTSLESSSPEPGETVDEPLDVIRLEFADAILPDEVNAVGLFGPDDAEIVASENAAASQTVLELAVEELPVTGEYTVRWRITAEDGDRQDGAYVFTYDGPTAGGTAPIPTPTTTAEPTPTPTPTAAPVRTTAPTPTPAPAATSTPAPDDAVGGSFPGPALVVIGAIVAAAAVIGFRRRRGGA